VRFLLDTHVLLWALADDPRLSGKARALIQEDANTLLWSAASTWELAIKAGLKRIHFREPLAAYLPRTLESEGIESLPVTTAHAAAVESLPRHHADPFDRLLIAQTKVEGVALLSADRIMRRYGVEVVW
jgi:PIN domain nuclease of toxin-antitoxin system